MAFFIGHAGETVILCSDKPTLQRPQRIQVEFHDPRLPFGGGTSMISGQNV